MRQAWQQILKVAWTETLCREVSYYKVIKDYDKNDFLGPLSSMALNRNAYNDIMHEQTTKALGVHGMYLGQDIPE